MVGMNSAKLPFVSVKFDDLRKSDRYYFMTSTIVPRPIAVVLTQDEQGTDNLAPFSYFNAVSSDPPCVMFSMGKKRDHLSGQLNEKDTLQNILKTKEFTVHIAQAAQIKLVDDAGEELAYGESE